MKEKELFIDTDSKDGIKLNKVQGNVVWMSE